MANATLEKVAPTKKEGLQTKEDKIFSDFGIILNPNYKYMFELAEKNEPRGMPVIEVQNRMAKTAPHKDFRPSNNIVLTSQIVWEGERTILRYYDGCNTIFASGQPKEKETIDALIKQTNRDRLHFEEGKWGAYGDEKMLLAYMFAASWNAESPYRTRTASMVWIPRDGNKAAQNESILLDRQELALKYAKEADDKKMMIHVRFLDIPTIDYDSGNDLSKGVIRTAYRKAALRDADGFIRSFTDDSMETKYYIEEALSKGMISYNKVPNKATWKTGAVICDISGIHSQEGVIAKLIEFSKLSEGEEFTVQLKAFYN